MGCFQKWKEKRGKKSFLDASGIDEGKKFLGEVHYL